MPVTRNFRILACALVASALSACSGGLFIHPCSDGNRLAFDLEPLSGPFGKTPPRPASVAVVDLERPLRGGGFAPVWELRAASRPARRTLIHYGEAIPGWETITPPAPLVRFHVYRVIVSISFRSSGSDFSHGAALRSCPVARPDG